MNNELHLKSNMKAVMKDGGSFRLYDEDGNLYWYIKMHIHRYPFRFVKGDYVKKAVKNGKKLGYYVHGIDGKDYTVVPKDVQVYVNGELWVYPTKKIKVRKHKNANL